MPVAILAFDQLAGASVLSFGRDADLLDALRDIVPAPGFETVEEASLWLSHQHYPSGWYRTAQEARARLGQDRKSLPMSGEELAQIRAELALSRAVFAQELGFSGTANTRHKQIWEMERARKPVMPERARIARALLALARLEKKPH